MNGWFASPTHAHNYYGCLEWAGMELGGENHTHAASGGGTLGVNAGDGTLLGGAARPGRAVDGGPPWWQRRFMRCRGRQGECCPNLQLCS